MEGFRGERRESQQGGRTVITEPGRIIVTDPGGRSFIRHNEVDRFRYGARDIQTRQVGNETRTIVIRPDGTQIITVVGRDGQLLGKYYGPPATWEHRDGSKVSGAQVAVAPAGAGAIALQLVKANSASGEGALQGVSYIQRVATQGGVPPIIPCTSALEGQRQVVRYQTDYIFWRAA